MYAAAEVCHGRAVGRVLLLYNTSIAHKSYFVFSRSDLNLFLPLLALIILKLGIIKVAVSNMKKNCDETSLFRVE